jgi:hypothetical protein
MILKFKVDSASGQQFIAPCTISKGNHPSVTHDDQALNPKAPTDEIQDTTVHALEISCSRKDQHIPNIKLVTNVNRNSVMIIIGG